MAGGDSLIGSALVRRLLREEGWRIVGAEDRGA